MVALNHYVAGVQNCGPGCECYDCINLPMPVPFKDHSDARLTESDGESLHSPADGSSTEESDSKLDIDIVTNMDIG